MKKLTAGLLCAVLIFITAGFACEKKGDQTPEQQKAEFIAYATDIVTAFRVIGPIISRDRPSLLPKWNKGTDIARKVLAAVEASDKVQVAHLVAELIPIVNEAVAEFTDNTAVLVSLALADIGLHFFVNHFDIAAVPQSARRSAARGKVTPVQTIEEFKAKRAWGCDLLPEKCVGLKRPSD